MENPLLCTARRPVCQLLGMPGSRLNPLAAHIGNLVRVCVPCEEDFSIEQSIKSAYHIIRCRGPLREPQAV